MGWRFEPGLSGGGAPFAADEDGEDVVRESWSVEGLEGVFVGEVVAEVSDGGVGGEFVEEESDGVAFIAAGAKFDAAVEGKDFHSAGFSEGSEQVECADLSELCGTG